ncbi:MAG: hypothetical protein ABIR94_17885 [Rubrivivax sp.]
MAEQVLAAVVLLVCVAALVRLCLSERRRYRLDFALRNRWQRLRGQAKGLWQRRRTQKRAAREAEAAIHRARGKTNGSGPGHPGSPGHTPGGEDNVIRPESFKRPRKPH